MKIKYVIRSIKLIKLSIATTIILMLININLLGVNYGYYNKIFAIKMDKILAKQHISLIITTVTGDSKYKLKDIEDKYKKLQILHLLVLSGSNISIIIMFISYIKRNNNFVLFVIYFLTLVTYFCYISFLHPVARALIFILFNDFITTFGLKSSFYSKALILGLSVSLTFIYFEFSSSFLLSVIFYKLVVLFPYFERLIVNKNKFIYKIFLFPIYMTLFSIPIQLYFFKYYDFKSLLLSNLLIVPIYDFFTFLMYLTYFISFITINKFIFRISAHIMDLLFLILEIIDSLLSVI